MDDRYVLIIEQYIKECTIEPELDDPDHCYFDLHSYSRWAAYEVYNRFVCEAMKLPPNISGKEPLTPIEIVEDFIDEMDYYMQIAQSDRVREIFQIARDEGKCILLYICSFVKGESK